MNMDPVALIQNELARRAQKNPSYSMRAFARSVGISHTVLSLVLSGKRDLSKKAAERLADHLGLDPLKRNLLLSARKARATRSAPAEPQTSTLTLESFAAISEWQHFAILSLLELPDAKCDARWVAKRLGISQALAKISLDRLKRLGMIVQDDQGRWRQSPNPIRIENTHSTAATRRFHKDLLGKAIDSLENDPFEVREMSSITLAMDPKILPYAQSKIRKFRRELCQELESLSAPSEVYHLSVQLFPLTQAPKKEKST